MTLEVRKAMPIGLLPESSVQSLTGGLKARAEVILDEIVLTVAKEDYRSLCERLFNAGFDFPSSLTGVDMEWGLGVVLHLQQLESKRKVAVRVYVAYDDVHLPTVSDLWGGVDWHEREAYDLVGLHFDGHHDHRRILLEDHWTIHPLQRKYNTRGYVIPTWTAKPWPSPAPWEEGFTPFGAAAAPAAHAPAVKPAAAPAASSPAVPVSEAAPSAPVSSEAPAVSSAAPVVVAPATEAPKKVAKKWVPKGAGSEIPSAPVTDETAIIAASVAEAAPSVAAEVNLATPPVEPPSSPDDLHRIEGIGPKMDGALQTAGITTFAKLAASGETEIRAAIEAAGLSFAPSMNTWAQQAALLAKGDEAGFKALTDQLTAGRDAATAASSSTAAPATASETPVTKASSVDPATTESPVTEEKPRNPKIKRWNPNG